MDADAVGTDRSQIGFDTGVGIDYVRWAREPVAQTEKDMEGQSKSPSKGSEANGFVSEAQRFISALAAELAGLPDCDGEIVQIVNQHVVVEKQSRSAVDEALAAIEALATKRAAKSIQDAAQDNAQ